MKRISARARQLFRRMQAAEDREVWWSLHGQLHNELGLPPWAWPCVIGPNEQTNGEPNSFAAQCDADARALYDALDGA